MGLKLCLAIVLSMMDCHVEYGCEVGEDRRIQGCILLIQKPRVQKTGS